MRDTVDKYCEMCEFSSEGERGVRDLHRLVEDMGYPGHDYAYGTPIEVFLIDNPGAIEAIVEWIKEQNFSEWKENLKSNLLEEEEEDD